MATQLELAESQTVPSAQDMACWFLPCEQIAKALAGKTVRTNAVSSVLKVMKVLLSNDLTLRQKRFRAKENLGSCGRTPQTRR